MNDLPVDHTCFRCDKQLPTGRVLNDRTRIDHFDGCSSVSIYGGYGMFHDNMETNCEIETNLCHDCTVELFRFFKYDPRTMSDMRGLHPYMDANGKSQEFPCCEYGWKSVKGGIIYGFDPDTVHLHPKEENS